jgi:TPR repeat protein
MGFFYGRGLIVKRANKEAQLYFIRGKNRMMEQQGLLYAFPYEIKLAKMYQEGTMLDKNPWGAFIIFSEWARNGHPESLYQTAHAMEVGYPVKEDLKDAAHYYLLAAQKGYAPAMTSIARLYFFGRGVDRDLQAALDWIKKAIKLGNKEAIVLSLYYNATDGNQKVIALNYARIAVEVAKVKEPSFVPEAIKLYQKTLKYLSKKDLLIAQDTYPIFQELQKYMLQRRKNWFK